MKVNVDVIENNGLTLQRFGFELEGDTIYYREHFTLNRDEGEVWPDKQPRALSFEQWLVSEGLEESGCCTECDPVYWKYRKYEDSMNPVRQKTKDGRVKMGGTYSCQINGLPECSPEVAELARKVFIEKIQWATIKYQR